MSTRAKRAVEDLKHGLSAATQGTGARARFFTGRVSPAVARALIAHGLELPEQLLVMPMAGIEKVKGLGPDGLAEVKAYRARFLPTP